MEEKNQIKNQKVETYADDMAKAIESGQGSVIKSIIKEQEEKENQKEGLSIEGKKNKVFIISGILLVFLTFFVFVAVFVFRDKVLTSTVAPQFVPMIFLDKTNVIDATGLSKENLVKAVVGQVNVSGIQTGEVEGIYLTNNKKAVGFREFNTFIRGNIPLDKITFLSDNFLIGLNSTTNTTTEKNLFFLLQDRSMSDIFGAMKGWENKMFFDLHGFFGIEVNADTNYLMTKDFEDGIIQNKNARILKDNNGNIVLMYVFVNDTSILITNSEATSKEIITRLANSQIAK
jgi:hypothetical protein